MLSGSSPQLETLAHFVCKYARCASERDRILSQVKREQFKCYKKNDEDELRNDFKCFSDFLTTSDEAFTLWQARQSVKMWENKRRNPDDRGLKYTCSTLYTNGHRKRKRGSVAVSQEGLNNYDEILQFFSKLRRDPHYDVFRRICNAKAKKLGLLENIGGGGDGTEEDEESDCEDGEVPCFDIDDGIDISNISNIVGV